MILTFALLLMSPADADGWVLLSRNRQLTNFIDARSIRSVGSRRRLRERVVFATTLPSGTASAEYEVEISCEARIIALWGGVELDRRGRVLEARKHSQPPVRSIRPGSVADRIFHFVCDRSPQSRPSGILVDS